MGHFSILGAFAERARTQPAQTALVVAGGSDPLVYEQATYGELLSVAERYHGGLIQAGLGPRQSLVLEGPPSVDFYAILLAALACGLRVGLIPHRLDPAQKLSALHAARPRVVVAGPELLGGWSALSSMWPIHRYRIDFEDTPEIPSVERLLALEPRELRSGGEQEARIISFQRAEQGLIQGVERTSPMLLAEHLSLAAHVPSDPDDVELTDRPEGVLHNLAGGITSVLMPQGFAEEAAADAGPLVHTLSALNVTSLQTTPELAAGIARHLRESSDPPPPLRLRQLVLRGAGAPPAVCRDLVAALPDTHVVIVYGTDVAAVIASVSAGEVLAEPERGRNQPARGLLVGTPVEGVEVGILALPVRIKERVSDDWVASHAAQVGEVVVRGSAVSRDVLGEEDPLRTHIRMDDWTVWRRTGDLGRRDVGGRLWLVGRVGEEPPRSPVPAPSPNRNQRSALSR